MITIDETICVIFKVQVDFALEVWFSIYLGHWMVHRNIMSYIDLFLSSDLILYIPS